MSSKKLLHILILTILAAFAVSPIVLGANAIDILRRSEDADKHVSYRGLKTVNVYFAGRSAVSTLKVVHLKPNKTRTEYFTPAQIAGTILIEDGPNIWKYDPRSSEWQKACVRQQDNSVWEKVLKNYDVKIIGTDSIAGRPTYVIHATPRHKGENAHRVWIDKDYFLTIRTQEENSRGVVVDSSRYTNIEINPGNISQAAFKISGKVKSTNENKATEIKVVKPGYLPKGYKLVAITNMSVNCRCCAHLQFSNGVNTISMFQRPTDKCNAQSQMKSKSTNILTWVRGGMLFTLIGKVPRAELQKIADSTK